MEIIQISLVFMWTWNVDHSCEFSDYVGIIHARGVYPGIPLHAYFLLNPYRRLNGKEK